jgi:hypothetical protein
MACAHWHAVHVQKWWLQYFWQKKHFLLPVFLSTHQAIRIDGRKRETSLNNRHPILPRHGIYTPCTSNTMATQGSPDGTTTSLLLMVVDTRPIRLQQPIAHRGSNNEGNKPILGLSWSARDMKRINPRAHTVGSLSNVVLLRIYWFAQGRLETWVRSRLPKHLNGKKVEIESC